MFFSCFSQVTVCVICMVMHYSITEAVLWLTVPSVTHKCVSYTIYFSMLEFLFLFLHATEYMTIFFFLKILKYALNSPISFRLILPLCFFEERPFYSVGFLWLWLTIWTERYVAAAGSTGGTGTWKAVFLVSLSQTVSMGTRSLMSWWYYRMRRQTFLLSVWF